MQIKIIYIFYKLINSLIWNFCKLQRLSPCIFYYKKSAKISKLNTIVVDLNSINTHLGDRLFFFPLINFFQQNNIQYFVKCDLLTVEIFHAIYNYNFNIYSYGKNIIYVIPKWDFLNNLSNIKNSLFIDFTDYKCEHKITSQLIYSFAKLFELIPSSNSSLLPPFLKNKQDSSSEKIIIYSNYVNSGNFRISKKLKYLMTSCLHEFLVLNMTVFHIGSKEDKLKDNSETYNIHFLDMRGNVPIINLINMYKSGNVHTTIAYDNFWMHISNIFQVPCYVVFRGRYLKKNVEHHYTYVNNTFEIVDKSNIFYLN